MSYSINNTMSIGADPSFALAAIEDVSSKPNYAARLGFAALWIDDDLRIAYHRPADSSGRRSGCFCQTCIAAFNAETGGKWTRETLAGAVLTDDAVCARWRRFSIQSLVRVALLNLRISEQGPVRILLRGVPPTWKGVVWHEMRREPVKLALERTGGETYATIPSVGAWNGGYLSGAGAMRDGTGD